MVIERGIYLYKLLAIYITVVLPGKYPCIYNAVCKYIALENTRGIANYFFLLFLNTVPSHSTQLFGTIYLYGGYGVCPASGIYGGEYRIAEAHFPERIGAEVEVSERINKTLIGSYGSI